MAIDVTSLPDWMTHSLIPDPKGAGRFADEDDVGVWQDVAAGVTAEFDPVDTVLWPVLLWADPNYARGAQQIGDCASWGTELAGTINLAATCREKGNRQRFCELATEPIYGLARVEVKGVKAGGWGDGSNGWANARALRDYGALLRQDYSVRTGNPDHDLSRYSGKRAKDWGNYGCGGKADAGKLDAVAKENPVKLITRCRNFNEVGAAIAGSRVPVTLASNYGCSMKRNQYGECGWTKSWSHLMCMIGVRWGKRPAVLIAQSWGPNTCSGPSGDEFCAEGSIPSGGTPKNILGFTWWMPAETVDKAIASGEAWAIGRQATWKVDRSDWSMSRFGFASEPILAL